MANVTVVVQIGNSDDKLSQRMWSVYVEDVDSVIVEHQQERHFYATSAGHYAWQNACWVVEVDEGNVEYFVAKLARCRHVYHQDSIAVTIGKTEFI